MKLHLYTALLATAVLLAACGGTSDDAITGTQAEAGSEGGEVGDAAGTEGGGVSGEPVRFDAGALGNEPLNVVDLQPLDRGGPTPPPVAPVIDTCAALSAADFDAIVASEASFGEETKFVATSLGAACDYTSDTHLVRVLVGSTDQVNTTVDSPGMFLPLGSGAVSETVSPDDGAVTILSEDSFGLDTPFAAFTNSGTYGVMVSNVGGTGIDRGSDGALYSLVASAVSAGVADAPPPPAEEEAQPEIVAGDPCSVWTVAELDAFLIDEAIEEALTELDSCSWTGAQVLGEIALFVLPQDTSVNGWQPIADGSPVFTHPESEWVFVDAGDVVLNIRVSKDVYTSGAGSPGIDAAVALAENLLARLG